MRNIIWSIIGLASLKLAIMFLIAYAGGILVKFKHVKVNYTRKIDHSFLYFIPALLDHFWLGSNLSYPIMLTNQAIFGFASFLIFVKPIRENVPMIATAFSSFDRPEDRPYTLAWYVSQVVVGYIIMVPVIALYVKYHMLNLLNIQILISVFGDGLAEPIGVRFGRHKYTAYSLFPVRKYERSLEGSLTVFIVSVIVVWCFIHAFSPAQFLIALAIIPIAMTIVEGISPHTWDNPFLILTGCALIFAIKILF